MKNTSFGGNSAPQHQLTELMKVRITSDQKNWLKTQSNASKLIRNAIDELISKSQNRVGDGHGNA
ncbi:MULTISPECIES: hypothetical protein [Vibrio]|uniref:hypothetical protein n=1 Tax=Vibrio TaxID=662 RepID=UPI001B82F65E|nr:hypothetical protein [Vibrio metschnikovii]EGR0775412.1 hypothetical protein [Vibrio cholerae]EGR0776904.1 hypothetical protein [Vibrio cholerae]EGR0780687.1 hypothetical protein [Vibrio cholerae]EGR0822975.1 hypothetical protein [Vibrio cholerae]EGR0831342.1 hypothetical protein [Vibrio cholerae]